MNDLAALLERHRADIATAWAARVRDVPGNGYSGWAFDEVVAWAEAALGAIIEREKRSSVEAIEAHAASISQQRAEQRFEIDQVIDGLLLLDEVALPWVVNGCGRSPGEIAASVAAFHASLRLMASQFAAVFATAMREQRLQVAVLEERNRLARDLHDSVSQAIYGVGMFAEAAARLLETGDVPGAAQHLREVRDWAGDALREMRFLIFELRPPLLREDGLIAALKARLSAVENRAGVRAVLTADEGDRLPYEIEEALYGIAREALNNGLRHARATNVQVRLTRGQHMTTLTVDDDGSGFNPERAVDGGGLGLAGMRERAARIDALLTIESHPGEGTRVSVKVPQSAIAGRTE